MSLSWLKCHEMKSFRLSKKTTSDTKKMLQRNIFQKQLTWFWKWQITYFEKCESVHPSRNSRLELISTFAQIIGSWWVENFLKVQLDQTDPVFCSIACTETFYLFVTVTHKKEMHFSEKIKFVWNYQSIKSNVEQNLNQ